MTVIANDMCANSYPGLIDGTKICTSTVGGKSPCDVSFHLNIVQKLISCPPRLVIFLLNYKDHHNDNLISLLCICNVIVLHTTCGSAHSILTQ